MIIIPGGMPQIVDEETFKMAQARKEANKYGVRSKREKETYLLTGLVFCKECGHAFTGNRRYSGRNKTKYVTYRCTNHNKGEKCTCKEVNRDYLENFVLDLICEKILAPEMTKKLLADFKEYQKKNDTAYRDRIGNLISEKNEITKKLENLYIQLETGEATEWIRNRIIMREEEKKRISRKIEKAKAIFRNLESSWPHMTDKEKQSVCQELIDRVVIHKDGFVDVHLKLRSYLIEN